MQIGSGGSWEKFRNRSGSMYFPPLNVYRRNGHQYNEPRKSRKEILDMRRLRSSLRNEERATRKFDYGWGGGALVGAFTIIMLLPLLFLATPLLPFVILISMFSYVFKAILKG